MPNVLYAPGSIQEFRTDDANVLLPAEAYNADIVALRCATFRCTAALIVIPEGKARAKPTVVNVVA
jgi:hypothetical protein